MTIDQPGKYCFIREVDDFRLPRNCETPSQLFYLIPLDEHDGVIYRFVRPAIDKSATPHSLQTRLAQRRTAQQQHTESMFKHGRLQFLFCRFLLEHTTVFHHELRSEE